MTDPTTPRARAVFPFAALVAQQPLQQALLLHRIRRECRQARTRDAHVAQASRCAGSFDQVGHESDECGRARVG
ncbi:hypothetical protein SB778_35575, partial [Paraburkholderia sp. SIMBA_050]